MEKIFTEEKDFHETIVELNDTKKHFRKAFLGNAGIIIGVFLAFVAAVTTLTDIKITSFGDVANLGMRYFVLLFVTYQMYVNTADSGSRRGVLTDVYRDSQAKYNELKGKIISAGLQSLLPKFCTEYIKRELKNARTVIVATIGMSHEDLEPYLTKSEKDIDEDKTLSKVQKKIIKKALRVKPIKLTPDMIMQQGSHGKRSPLGITPKQKKQIAFGGKFVTTAITAAFVVSLAFEVILNPTTENVIYMLVSCVPVTLNGFTGYKFGYENIVFDTVDYTDAQCSVIEEFLQEVGYGNKTLDKK